MLTSTTTAAAKASTPTTDRTTTPLWVPPNERPPTEDEEVRAREHSLSVSNETEIGHDAKTNQYNHRKVSKAKNNYYKKLDSHNRDNYWKYRDEVDVPKDCDRQLKLKTALGIASQLGLSDLHTQIVIDRLFEIDGRRFGQRTEAVALCLCGIVLNEQIEDRYGDEEKVYHPARGDSNNDTEFVRQQDQLIDTFGPITKSRLQSIYGKLTQGDPPLKNDEETRRFVTANSTGQRHPSFSPEYALPQSTGDA